LRGLVDDDGQHVAAGFDVSASIVISHVVPPASKARLDGPTALRASVNEAN
jgi:hypothetical protein